MKLMSCESTHLSACHKAKSVVLKTLNQFDSLEELSDPSDLDYDSDIQLLNYNSESLPTKTIPWCSKANNHTCSKTSKHKVTARPTGATVAAATASKRCATVEEVGDEGDELCTPPHQN